MPPPAGSTPPDGSPTPDHPFQPPPLGALAGSPPPAGSPSPDPFQPPRLGAPAPPQLGFAAPTQVPPGTQTLPAVPAQVPSAINPPAPRFGAYDEAHLAQAQQAPVCYRHPDRVTYVTCQRCGRPVCPECQRPAAVGVQCVDCVKASAKAAPARRSILGHKMPDKTWVTYAIIGLCLVSFALQWLTHGQWTSMFAFAPSIGAIQPWRFLTTAFLHSTSFIGHILFNMLAFYQCGQLLERTLGHARFAALCLLTALGGSVGYLLLAQNPAITTGSWYIPVVGASGMVFGLFGALIPVLKRAGSSVRSIIGLIAINAVLGFVVPGIAWQAHLGGFIVGIAMAYAYAHIPRAHAKLVAWLLPVGVFVLLVALAVARYEATGWLDLVRQLGA